MVEQTVGNGANLFLLIIATLVAFGAAMGYVDYRKTKKEESH